MEEAKKEFLKYTENYKKYGDKILLKIDHTMRVVDLCEDISRSLNLSEKEVALAKLAGLLHDIGRFEQYKNYQTYDDLASIDHGTLGAEILSAEFIRKFNKNPDDDQLLRNVIINHNKYKMAANLTPKEKLICQIVRDADKIDIFNVVLESDILKIGNETISKEVYEAAINKKSVLRKNQKTKADNLVCNLTFIYDINFPRSLAIIRKRDYIDRLIEKYLVSANEDFKEKLLKIKVVLDDFLEGV